MAFPRPLPAGYHLQPLAADRLRDVLDLDTWAFPSATSVDDLLALPLPLTWDRTLGVVADDDPRGPQALAAMHASYPFARFPVPGATLPVAGLTWVGVHPEHRRRGLLSAMIDVHLTRCRERGEPVSALFAAEPAIYGRFGYGLAAQTLGVTLSRRAELRPVPGADALTARVELFDPEVHADLVDRLHRAAAEPAGPGLTRPGWVTRETAELTASFLSDPTHWREGFESRRILVVARGGEPVGYALFRRKGDWGAGGPEGKVKVGEVVARDAAAAHALWSRLLDLDLTTEVTAGMLALDDPLLGLLVDPRAAQPRVSDNVWVRLVDVATALAGRRYATDVDVVLEVADDRLTDNAGRYRLRATAFGPAEVARTDDAADLALDVRDLGAAYLGGRSLVGLAAAGLVAEATPGALARASVAFGWPVAPAASWVF